MTPSRRSPAWLTWALTAALATIFVGARVASVGGFRHMLTVVGLAVVAGVTAWRALACVRTTGAERRVEAMLLVAHAVSLGATIAWLASPAATPPTPWVVLLALSLLPALAAQAPIIAARRAGGDVAIDELRVTRTMANGLSVACAFGVLFIGCNITKARDHKWDLSYFRPSSPSAATEAAVGGMGEPLHVLLFFPEINEVGDRVQGYFGQLANATGNVTVESHDPLARPDLVRANNVQQPGTVVLVYGERHASIVLDTNFRLARSRLRIFDAEVREAALKVTRPVRPAYLTTGHGEMALDKMSIARGVLEEQGFVIRPLGAKEGLEREVPLDAGLVLVLGPRQALSDAELTALDRYVARGGALLIALDPDGAAGLGPLEARLGLHYAPTRLVDEQSHVVTRGDDSDRALIISDQVLNHVSVSSMRDAGEHVGMVFEGTGSFDELPGVSKAALIHVVRSMPTTFADGNGNFHLDPGEPQKAFNLVTTVEDWTTAPGTTVEKRTTGVMLFADADFITDRVMQRGVIHTALFKSVVHWLGQVEDEVSELRPELDSAIRHSRSEDAMLFYGSIIGAPMVVLLIGAITLLRRRRRRAAPAATRAAAPAPAAPPSPEAPLPEVARAGGRFVRPGVAMHGLVLALALVLAYRVWTREAAGAWGNLPVWSEAADHLVAIHYDTGPRVVELERRADQQGPYLWAQAGQHSYLVDDLVGQQTLRAFAGLMALRDLGVLDDAGKQLYGLDKPSGTLRVTFSSATRELALGKSVPGARYAFDAASGHGYALSETIVDPFGKDLTLMELQLHPEGPSGVQRQVITSPTRSMTALYHEDWSPASWADSRHPDQPDMTLSELVERMSGLTLVAYPPVMDTIDLEQVLRVDYYGVGEQRTRFLELLAAPAGAGGPRKFYVRTELTRIAARVNPGWDQTIDDLLVQFEALP